MKPYECKACAKLLVMPHTLYNIESILVRNPMSIRNVGRPLVLTLTLFNIREFILVRNLINVTNVTKPLLCMDNLLDIIAFIQVRNPLNVRNVERLLDLIHSLLNIRGYTLLRNLLNVKNAGRPLDIKALEHIRETTWLSNPKNLRNLESPLCMVQTLFSIREFVLVRIF